jgi:hypothetical protein
MRRVLVVRQDDTWHVLGDDDLAAEVVAPKVPLPESQVPEFEHVRLTTKMSSQELWRLFQEAERVEFGALAAMRGGVPLSGVPGPEPKVPLPESPHEIEEVVIRQEIKATTDVLISLSASSSIVPAVPAGQTLPDTSLPSLMVAAPSLQQPSGRVQHPAGRVFDSKMDLEISLTVFNRILAGASAPFAGSPDLRPGAMDTSTNPAWLLFGYDHNQATFSSVYDVSENPNHGDHGF